jgi:radical SAM protein with 4Fe4S-binding SPASM domain
LDVVDWPYILKQSRHLGCKRVQFIGGEPTVHRRIKEFLSLAGALGYHEIEVYTNLVSLPETLLEVIDRVGARVATSFYSDSSKVHDDVTGSQGSFDSTVSNLKRILSRSIPVRVGLIEMQENAATLDKAINFLSSIGVDPKAIAVDYVRDVGRGSQRTHIDDQKPTLCGNCWSGKLAVSWNGECYPCVFARDVSLGNVTDANLEDIVKGKRLSEFRQALFSESMMRGLKGSQAT